MHNTDHTRNKIVSDHISLSNEEFLISQTFFLFVYCDAYWDKHCNVLKKPSEIASHSSFISYHMFVIYYCIHVYLKVLSINYENNKAFSVFVSRKVKYNNEEQHCMHNELPSKFFQDALTLPQKHMDQWRRFQLMKPVFCRNQQLHQIIANSVLD